MLSKAGGVVRRLSASSLKTLRMLSRCTSAECIGAERSLAANTMLCRFAPNRTGQPKNSLNSLVSEFRRWIKVKDRGTIGVSVRRRSSATNVVVPHSATSFSKPSRPGRNVVVDSDVSIGFFNDKRGRCVHKMMIAYQILNRIQCGARSRQDVVNNTQFTCVSFGCQVEPKAIVAD